MFPIFFKIMKDNRRIFIRKIGTLIPLTLFGSASYSQAKGSDKTLKLGIASYSFRNYSLEDTLGMTQRLGINNIALKSMHMPLDLEDEQIKSVASRIHSAGIDLYGAGVIYMNNEKEVENAFHYAKTAGLKTIIGVPQHNLLPVVERWVKETGIKLAIHNHGPGDEVYPSPESIYTKIRNLDARIGICLDIGHTQRIGLDPAQEAKKYFDRLMDIHIKDVSASTDQGESTIIGRGVINIPAFLRTLIELNYTGIVSFEYEIDPSDIMPGISESIGYVRGVLATL